jgi:hypothetical protein
MTSAANISKCLWGSGTDEKLIQRKPLRDSVDVKDTSAIRSKRMRNNYDHFDERLDEWWSKSPHKQFCDLNFGPVRQMFEEIDIFRNYDPQNHSLIFWSQTTDLTLLTNEVFALEKRLDSLLKETAT